jgi:conjugal transfer mating pair stabilization protein TraN
MTALSMPMAIAMAPSRSFPAALRCRPAGLLTTFSNCCRNRGTIVKDGMGSSLTSLSTKIAVAKGVLTGMKAAYTAFQAGASASAAASAAGHAIIVGIDPTSIAIDLAINLVLEFLLSGCDQQDMETGILKGSGMCHEIGTGAARRSWASASRNRSAIAASTPSSAASSSRADRS